VWYSHYFCWGGRESTLSSEDTFHEASQPGHGGDCGSSTKASLRDQGSGGGTGLCIGSIKNISLIKTPIADWGTPSMMKTEPTALCTISGLISCEPDSCRHICNGSYTSGDLKRNDTLIAVKDGTNFKVGSAEDLQGSQHRALQLS